MPLWPWLAQLGQDRGGFYSYQWLENLAGCQMENADRIRPKWQHRALGETVHVRTGARTGARGLGDVRPRSPLRGRTRLIARGGVPRGVGAVAYGVLMEIPQFLMERRMLLLGIEERAEASGA